MKAKIMKILSVQMKNSHKTIVHFFKYSSHFSDISSANFRVKWVIIADYNINMIYM